jgi:hypothetical protein
LGKLCLQNISKAEEGCMNKSLWATNVVIVSVWFFLVSAQATTAPKPTLPQRHGHTNDVLPGTSTVNARPRATAPPLLPTSSTAIGFQTAPHISAGTTPSTALAVSPYLSVGGDFNHDGRQDVASIGQDANNVFWLSILLSNGDGTFQPPVLTAVTFTTSDLLAVGDLNRDGSADVVVVHAGSIDVFLGDGTGKFSTAVNYPTSISNPVAVALLDNNGDSFVDVIIASGTPDGTGQSPVNTLLGNGSGALAAATTAHYNGAMGYGVLADLNADGYLDLVSATQVFFGSAGDYQPPVTLTTRPDACQFPYGTANSSVTVADVNGDGRPDVVTADCSNGTITAFLNQGNGSFAAGTSTWAAYLPSNVTIADVNGDGKPDAIVADFYSMDIYVLLGNKDGTFVPAPMGYPAGGDLWTAPVVADFNSDGRPDILIPSGIGGQWESLVLLTGLGNGGLVAPHDYLYAGGAPGTTAYAWGIASADLNGDGLPDFVVGNQSGDTTVGVTVFLSNAASPGKSLHQGVNYGSGGNLEFVALADIDGDGNPDMIASNTGGEIQVFLGHGDGTFDTVPTKVPVGSGAGLGRLVVGDFDGDGKPDIAVLDTGTVASNQTFLSNVWVLLNRSATGTPAFTAPVNYALTSLGGEAAAADLGNHHLDLLITQTQSTSVSILLGDGTGSFARQPDFDLGSFYPSGLAVAQLNPAGHPDLLVSVDDSNAGMGIAVATGNGDGTFAAPVLYPGTSNTTGTITPFPQDVRVADLNGDGILDIVYANAGDGTVGVLYGTGQWGSGQSPFYEPIEFAANGAPLTLLLADINGDGALDAVIEGSGYSGITTLLNTGANQLALYPGSVVLSSHLKSARSMIPHAAPGQFTFTATVGPLPLAGAPPSSTPSGTVIFRDGTTQLGVVTTSAGSATITPTLTTLGTHIITAIYSGDDNYVGQTQATLIQTIDAPLSLYTLSATPTDASLTPGRSAQFVITATPNPVSFDTVTFSCGALPPGISCSFNPSSLVLNGTSAKSTTLTLTVAPNFVASTDPVNAPSFPMAGMTFAMFGCALVVGLRERISGRLAPVLVVVALAILLAATGCSNNSGNGSPAPTPMTVRVLASSLGKGGAQQINLTVSIHP